MTQTRIRNPCACTYRRDYDSVGNAELRTRIRPLLIVDSESCMITAAMNVLEKNAKPALIVMLVAHALLLGVQGYYNAPNLDETAHLPAGLSHWQFGNFALYRVNPPLIRMWSTIPVLLCSPETDWETFDDAPLRRAEFSVGRRFIIANGWASFRYFTLARWMLIPFSLMGAVVCCQWAKELFGTTSGLLACGMWCFCPNLLAWGASMTPDGGAAAFGVLAGWLFWKWLKQPSWTSAGLAGFALGLVELVKSSWIILFGLWPLLWLIWRCLDRSADGPKPRAVHLTVILLVGLYVLNVGYGFEGTCQRLDEFTFFSETLGGPGVHDNGGNRFTASWIAALPVPVPANYLSGIDVQKREFERGKWSYLRGEQKQGGWWYYYLYAMLVKTPLGFLGLIGLAVGLFAFRPELRSGWRNEIVLIAPAIVLLVLVSSQTGFNRYLRYVLPVYPFLYVFASRCAACVTLRRTLSAAHSRRLHIVAVGLFTFGVGSSLWVAPYSMSYFNLAVGGPVGGKNHLLDANIDWGQDLLRLKRWVDEHPAATPLYGEIFTFVNLNVAGVQLEPIPPLSDPAAQTISPGWYTISVNELMGYRHFGQSKRCCIQFQQIDPIEKIGYSIYLYYVERSDSAENTRPSR